MISMHELHTIMNPQQASLEKIGKDVPFERIRRVTGYLAGDVSRFNNAKRAEEHDRVKHSLKEVNKHDKKNRD